MNPCYLSHFERKAGKKSFLVEGYCLKGGGIMAGFDENDRDPEVEALIDRYPEERDIYRYMRDEFDKVLDTYDPDIHDREVAVKASDKFDVSVDYALDLYTRMVFKIAEFQQRRFNKSK